MTQVLSRSINDKRIFAFKSKEQLLDYVDLKKAILIALNAEKFTKKDQELDKIINENIGYADGIGAVWALRRKGHDAVKIPGAEFWLDIIEKFNKSKSFYLLGATQEIIEKTVDKLSIDFPNIDIKGFRNGFLEQGDEIAILEELKEKKPDFVFVAMGSPKQEFLMSKFLRQYPALYMGLGGSFDVYSGFKKRAPKIFIRFGLEWFYRLLKEPTRISRQINLIKFFFKIIFGKI